VIQEDERPAPGSQRPEGTDDDSEAVVRPGQQPASALTDLDQIASELDQRSSDSDQAASDRDQSQANADQRTSDRDQAAADRDQAAADRDQATQPASGESNADYEASRVDRLQGTLERVEAGWARAQTATERQEQARLREENARLRDLRADVRDRAGEQRDRATAALERKLDDPGRASSPAADLGTLRTRASADRARGAVDRARAAADREQAAADRAAGTYDREQARAEVLRAQLDHLTGAYGRELGMVTLDREINRAQHGNGHLVLAFIDVDGLKQVNDRHGHAAGDELLRDVVAAIQTHLRSYDPIVRIGGDEFVCALADCQPDEARRRFQAIQATIQQLQPAARISVGYAQLRPEDTLNELTKRGDAALYEAKLTK
jgi:diguanylate cyclase (GGDEF)-like protein